MEEILTCSSKRDREERLWEHPRRDCVHKSYRRIRRRIQCTARTKDEKERLNRGLSSDDLGKVETNLNGFVMPPITGVCVAADSSKTLKSSERLVILISMMTRGYWLVQAKSKHRSFDIPEDFCVPTASWN